ncbi:MAG: response regulator transcription factor [Burkholderiales bacterium]
MKIRVLIADDHAVMRDCLGAFLTASSGIEVVAQASDGREAVRQVAELAPDVVLIDIAMQGLNGIEAVRAIREQPSPARLIMLSMHSTSEHVYRAFEAGADGYLLKESAGTEVLAAVRSVHRGRRYVSRALGHLGLEMRTASGRSSPLDRLSARERQVLQLVVEGKSSMEIATIVHLSPKTVETYRSRMMTKLGVGDVTALVKFALNHGITSLD